MSLLERKKPRIDSEENEKSKEFQFFLQDVFKFNELEGFKRSEPIS